MGINLLKEIDIFKARNRVACGLANHIMCGHIWSWALQPDGTFLQYKYNKLERPDAYRTKDVPGVKWTLAMERNEE